MTRSALLGTTAMSQPLPTPSGLLDARQRGHLAELASVEEALRHLPRFGATSMWTGLMMRANVLMRLSTMTEAEEQEFLAEAEDEPEILSSKRGSITASFPDGEIAFEGTYDYLKITGEDAA